MGMSTHIQAFIPDTDPEYIKHKKVLLACREAGVSLPKETQAYFEASTAHPELYLLEEKLEIELKEDIDYKDFGEDGCQGFEIYLDKLPKAVTKLRFYNSY